MKMYKDLVEFLAYTSPQKEVSVIIVDDEEEIKPHEFALKEHDFITSFNVSGLIQSIRDAKKSYIIITQDNVKDVYDMATQYPTGQISTLDTQTSEIVWVSPDYIKGVVVLIFTKKMLEELEQKDLNFLAVVGLTYQK